MRLISLTSESLAVHANLGILSKGNQPEEPTAPGWHLIGEGESGQLKAAIELAAGELASRGYQYTSIQSSLPEELTRTTWWVEVPERQTLKEFVDLANSLLA